MNAEHISDAMNLLDDDIIDEANALRGGKKRPRASWPKWAGLAACLALAVFAGASLLHTGREHQLTIVLPR